MLKLLTVNHVTPVPSTDKKRKKYTDSSVQRTRVLQQICQLNNGIKLLSKKLEEPDIIGIVNSLKNSMERVFSPQRSWKILREIQLQHLLPARRGLKPKDVMARGHQLCNSATHLAPSSVSTSVTATILPLLFAAVDKPRQENTSQER